MGDEADRRRSAARALAAYRVDDALLDAGRAGRVRDARPARAPRRGDHRRGPLRLAPAHLGPGGEPPPRPEGAARAAGRTGRAAMTARRAHARPAGAGDVSSTPHGPSSPAPAARRRARAADRLARVRRRGRGAARATAATWCSSPARSPATACARSCTSASAATRTRARSRCSSRAPSGSRRVADHPGVPWQVIPYERQLEIKRGQVDEALRRIGRLDGFELEEIVPALRAVALPQQARVLLRRRPPSGGELVCGFHAPAGGNRVAAIEDCLLASERGNLRARARLALVPRAGPERVGAGGRGRRGRSGARPAGASVPPASADARQSERAGRAPTGARACATSSCAKAGARASCRCGS